MASGEAAAGSSAEQRTAERVMLDLLGERLGVDLDTRRLTHATGAYVDVDGATTSSRCSSSAGRIRGRRRSPRSTSSSTTRPS